MVPLQSTEAQWRILSPQKTRAQTNTSIQRYWWKKPPEFYTLFSWVWACYLPCLNNIFSCLYNIPLWSKFFEPCLLFHNVRQHSENASETLIWRELTASNHEIRLVLSWAQTCSAVDLRIPHVGCHKLLRKLSLMCLVCSLAISLRSDGSILSTWQKKTSLAINMFALVAARFLSVLIITLRAELL